MHVVEMIKGLQTAISFLNFYFTTQLNLKHTEIFETLTVVIRKIQG